MGVIGFFTGPPFDYYPAKNTHSITKRIVVFKYDLEAFKQAKSAFR